MLQPVLVCKTNKDIASTGYSDNFSGHVMSAWDGWGSGDNRAELLCLVLVILGLLLPRFELEDEVVAAYRKRVFTSNAAVPAAHHSRGNLALRNPWPCKLPPPPCGQVSRTWLGPRAGACAGVEEVITYAQPYSLPFCKWPHKLLI